MVVQINNKSNNKSTPKPGFFAVLLQGGQMGDCIYSMTSLSSGVDISTLIAAI